MLKLCSIPIATGHARFAFAVSSFALLVALASSCGADRVVTAAEETSRRAAHVKPAKLPTLRIRQLPSGDRVLSLENDVYFEFDSAALTPEARVQLRGELLPRVLAFLARPGTAVSFHGYTDGAGDSAYNLRLSQGRAQATRRFLVAGGSPPRRLSARGFGEAMAVSSLPDQALRRVDVVLRKGGSR